MKKKKICLINPYFTDLNINYIFDTFHFLWSKEPLVLCSESLRLKNITKEGNAQKKTRKEKNEKRKKREKKKSKSLFPFEVNAKRNIR